MFKATLQGGKRRQRLQQQRRRNCCHQHQQLHLRHHLLRHHLIHHISVKVDVVNINTAFIADVPRALNIIQ